MATATTNKLPNFGENATLDSSIVNDTSELKETGFQPNTTIQSSQMNTYIKIAINALRGIVDTLYRSAIEQGNIDANSKAQDWQTYLSEGLNDLIVTMMSENNAETATKLQTPRTINISGDATGTAQSFDGTKNVVIPVDVKKAAALDSTNVGDATHPVYFDANGKPVQVNQKIANDISGSADSMSSTNVGSSTNPVYFNENGVPQATGATLNKSINGNAATATKLANERTIELTGDVIGEVNFDGSQNVLINTTSVITNAIKMVTSNTGSDLQRGSSTNPVYFVNGVPQPTNLFFINSTRFQVIPINPNTHQFSLRRGILAGHTIEVLYKAESTSTVSNVVSFGIYTNFSTFSTPTTVIGIDENNNLYKLEDYISFIVIYKETNGNFVQVTTGTIYVREFQG